MAVRATNHDAVSKSLDRSGEWEISHPEDLARLAGIEPVWLTARLARMRRQPHRDRGRRQVFIDIGGNVGAYTMAFAKAGYDVLYVEPMAANRRVFEASMCLNPDVAARITLVPLALTSQERSGSSCVAASLLWNQGNGRLACAPRLNCSSRSEVLPLDEPVRRSHWNLCEEVQVATLDNALARWLPDAGRVDVVAVKMDVEDNECAVLAGGHTLFQKYRPAVLRLENAQQATTECYESVSRRYGYRILRYNASGGLARVGHSVGAACGAQAKGDALLVREDLLRRPSSRHQ